jgi:hypothetical protein
MLKRPKRKKKTYKKDGSSSKRQRATRDRMGKARRRAGRIATAKEWIAEVLTRGQRTAGTDSGRRGRAG